MLYGPAGTTWERVALERKEWAAAAGEPVEFTEDELAMLHHDALELEHLRASGHLDAETFRSVFLEPNVEE